jgi:hypothetical protein
MPEVGVLNLQIHDDSESASKGLNHLTDALVRIQTALGTGLNLSGVSKPLNTFAKSVSGNSKALANVGTFLNAMKDYHKAFKEVESVKFNAQPIKDIKEAIGEGIKIGQAGTQITKIREALGGEWNVDNAYKAGMAMSAIGEGAKSIPSGLEKKANGVKALAEALNEYANVMERIKAVTGSSSFNGNEMVSATTAPVEQAKKDLVDYQQVVDRMKDIQEETKVSFREPLLKLNLQLHGRKGIPDDYGMDMDAMSRMTSSDSSDFVKIEETIHSAADAAGEFKVRLEEIGDAVTSIKYNPFEDMYQTFSKLSSELGWFKKESMRLMSGEDINRGVAQENALSIWNGWRPDFQMVGEPYIKDEPIIATVYTDAQETIHGVVEEIKEAVNETNNLGSATEKAQEKFTGYYANKYSFEDIYNGVREKAMGMNSLMSQWLHGQGSPEEQLYAMKIMAREFGMTLDEVKQKLASLNAVPATVNATDNLQRAYGMEMVQNIIDNYNNVDLLTMKMEGMKQALADDINQNKVDTQQIAERSMAIQSLIEKIEQLKQAQEETVKSTRSFGDVWHGMGKGIKSMFPTISSLIGRFKQIIKYRMIRSVIKHITSGFSEGLQNVYGYSKAIGGSFAPAMDSAATAINQMKNSLGAALAPAIQALVPVLNTVVNWFIQLVNYANQFFALLGGQQTWTRALPVATEAFSKQKKAAKGAGAAIKDLLADWDELNIIQSQTGGGSGAGTTTAEDYLKMFEEVNRFDNKIKDIVDFVKENFNTILTTVGLIEAGMLAWRFSKGVADVLPVLSKIALGFSSGATIALSVVLTDLTGQLYTDTGDPGWLIADALTGAVGATIAGGIAEKILAGSGIYTAAFTLALNGIVNIKNAIGAAAQQQRGRSFMLNALGAIESGIGAGLIAATAGACTAASIATGVVTGLIALTIGIALSIKAEKDAEYKQMAIDAFAAQGKDGIDPDEYLKELQAEMDRRTADSNLVVNTSITLGENTQTLNDTLESIKVLNETIKGNEKLSKKDADAFKATWDIVLETMREISEINYSTMYAGLDEAIKNGSDEIKEAAIEYKAQALKMETIMNGAHAAFEKEIRMLEDQIITGTIDEEGLKRYKELYEMLAEETETGLDKFRVALSEGMRFDFGSEDPIGKAVEFIKSMGNDTIQPALEAAEAQYNAEMESLEQSRKDLEKYHDKGFIKDDQYNDMKAFYDSMESFYFTRWEDQKKEINNSVNDALSALVEQSVAGYLELDSSDERALKSYVDNVFVPLEKAMEEAGLAVPEKLKQYIARNGKEVWKTDVAEQYAAGSKEALYETFYDEMMAGNIDDALKFSVAYELDLINKDPNYLTDETRKEIVNALEEAFADPTRIIQELKETLGWSYEDILNAFDFSKLDESEVSEITSLFESLREAETEALQYRTKIDPSKSDYLSWGEYTEEIEKVTKSYDELIKKIREYNGEDINNSGKLEGITPEINTANLVPVRLSASAGFNYSDTSYNNYTPSDTTVKTEPNDPQAEASTVAAGVQRGSADMVAQLATCVSLLSQLLQKEWNINVTPNSGWGEHNAKSNAAWTKMVGWEATPE